LRSDVKEEAATILGLSTLIHSSIKLQKPPSIEDLERISNQIVERTRKICMMLDAAVRYDTQQRDKKRD
jgi:hypothetical protein